MPQFVVHKIGFFYTDECYAALDGKGPVMAITRSLAEAQDIKKREDIKSMKGLTGYNAIDFYFDSDNYKLIEDKVVTYLKSEFNLSNENDAHFYELPGEINDEQALKFLEIMELSFHSIVEYGDAEEIKPDYELNEEEGDIEF